MNNRTMFSSLTVEWPTPKALYDRLDQEFHFTLDPCPVDAQVDGLSPLYCNWGGGKSLLQPTIRTGNQEMAGTRD